MPDIVKVDGNAVNPPFLHEVLPMSEEQYAEMLKKVGATQASLDRDAALLREWLAQQPHLPQLGAEYDPWLQRFLIASKNSLQRAKEYIENYCTSRALSPEMFSQEPSPIVDNLFSVIKSGVLPVVTPQGTRMVMTRYSKELGDDASQMDWGVYLKLTVHMADLFISAPGHPVDSEICVDLVNFSIGLSNSFVANLSVFKKFIVTVQDSIPIRYKAVHLLNAPAIIRTLVAMVRPILKDKLGERIIIHEDNDSFQKCVDKACLPSDYGGTYGKTLAEMCDDWNLVIHSNMPWFRARQKKFAADESKRVGGKLRQDEFGVEGSFRKLAVD